ncbi:MAG: GDSL-type esterase/lipase family protein [Paludibacter sp.]|nr:GDSL-type esterase/lipase family protein [Paludibacter sp.]
MSQNNFRFAILSFCLLILSIGINATESIQTTIKIDSKAKALIAPQSSSYKWYYNGQEIAQTQREVKITSPGTYEVQTTDQLGQITISKIQVGVSATGSLIKIFTIGDSTVADYTAAQYPWAGWGQELKYFFDATKIVVNNRARGGRSSRTYYQEGIWANVKAELDSNSYVFIQFGHNDRDFSTPARYTPTDSMKVYLRIYIKDSRAKGAIPVLVSPVSMNTGTRNVFTESGNDYRGAMLAVSQELNVPFLDLNTRSYNFYQQIGTEYASYFIHMGLLAGEYANYPTGYTDTYTHYQEMGALAMARMVTLEIKDKQTNPQLAPLAAALKPLYNVAVSLKVPSAGMSTISGDYPAGATITLKTRNTGLRTMKSWSDSINKITLNGNLVTFTMAAHNYNFVGNLVDCNGTSYGTAAYDTCGVCTGGTTKLSPCSNVIKFVDLCETNTNTLISLDKTPYSLYLKSDSVTNAYVSQQFNVAKTDSFYFAVTYNSTADISGLRMFVNDTVKVTNLLTKGAWNLTKFKLRLYKGINTIKIRAITQTAGGILLNYMALYSLDMSKISCVPNTTKTPGSFFQKDSLIVLEAENYNQLKVATNGKKWTKALFDNASKQYVVISPAGTTYSTGTTAETNAPILSYNVNFTHAGNYSVWARVYAFDATGDSYHLGLDSKVLQENINVNNSTKVYKSFTWINVANSNLVVPKAGIQSLDLFCMEPNLIIDKVILTQNTAYVPSGAGPVQNFNPADTLKSGTESVMMNNQDFQISTYPNPAQNQIKIAYNIPESNNVNISVVNTNGQLVANLVDQYQFVGKHEYTWNFSKSLPGINQGLYFVRFQIGDTMKTQKIIVIH